MSKVSDRLSVKKTVGGYGITDGRKWFAYIYPTAERAESVRLTFTEEIHVKVNISYPEAFMPVKG